MAYDCAGRLVRVSVRIVDPPLVSRLYLHWTLKPPLEDVTDPAVVAAHRNSILFKVTVPFEDDSWWHNSCGFPIDYFVYSAPTTSSSSSNVPSLTRLPPCFDERRRRNDEEDKWFKPYRRQRQRCMIDQDMGLLCHSEDGDEFTVADLTYRSEEEVELCLLHHHHHIATPMQWRIKKLPTPPDMKIYPCSLTTDTVFPIGDGRSLCWVDYYHGLLLVDVLLLLANNDNPAADHTQQLLRYIPLPKQALKSRHPCPDAFSPDPYQHVCITDDGIIKLVCIFTKYAQLTFTIITWSLDIHKGNWIKDCGTIMRDAEFFGLLDSSHRQSNSHLLPRVIPSFPVVSLADPDVICFLLKEINKDRNTYWAIEVNMREKVLLSTTPYIGEEEEEGHSPKKPCINFYGQYFVPSKLSSYMGHDASKSRQFTTFQALGGHRTSHKRPQVRDDGIDLLLGALPGKGAAVKHVVHRCHICGTVFATGRAISVTETINDGWLARRHGWPE
ncbi:hypothetical protein QOZ80_9AG0693080 [Eleusine coracana subsp. coracana]|nr:hypothetical protein QOZ80_9AG0693080 [Eleusine coracana subsp. coracana]